MVKSRVTNAGQNDLPWSIVRGMNTPLDVSDFPVLFPDFNGVVMISPDGEITHLAALKAAEAAAQRPVLICHRKWTEARLHTELIKPVDLLELFAFVRPAQFCLPTPSGLAARLGLAVPVSPEDKALTILRAAQMLTDELAQKPEQDRQKLARLADMMGSRGGNGPDRY